MNDYMRYIHISKYARFREKLKRRETWEETVRRYCDFMELQISTLIGNDEYTLNTVQQIEDSILRMDVMPSMRAMMVAGPALTRDHLASYNCAAIAVDSPRVFDEVFYILMNGSGVGFSVERQFITKLPTVAEVLYDTDTTIVVQDSKGGWAKSLKELIALLYNGDVPKWDLSLVRPSGARLKTFGGRACLTGDTILYKDRKKARGYNEITIKDLYDLERSRGKWEHKPNHFKAVRLRSLDEDSGKFFRNNIITVLDNGTAPVYRIVTENGYRIKATGNHRFMRDTGDYDYVDNFSIGELIAVNGSKEKKTGVCVDCGCSISRRSVRCRKCSDVNQQKSSCLGITARQRKDCRAALTEQCDICSHDGSISRLQVHHKDKNPWNNLKDNLQCLCEKCHRLEDTRTLTFGNPYSHKYLSFDTIISIEYVGEERVYDLQMQGPNHNFVANGFVSHNSGPEPLDLLFRKTVALFKRSAGRKLNSLECHDLLCQIADTVIVGGVRRSAMISASNLTDDRMRRCKTGEFYLSDPQRFLANNSVMYTERPDLDSFLGEFRSMYKSKAGERGMVNQEALKKKAVSCGRSEEEYYLLNPCGETILRSSGGLCNLSEVVIRPGDTLEVLKGKVRVATIIGTLQSTLTNFKYLRKIWKDNAEEERLLGVSLTGIMDHPIMSGRGIADAGECFNFCGDEDVLFSGVLLTLKKVATDTNLEWAERLGINPSKQLTVIKPSGTVSQLVDSSSGIHPRYSKYFIRKVTQDNKDPLTQMLKDQGVPHQVKGDKTYFSFPIKVPEGSITQKDMGPLEQLELWKVYRTYWCDGNPSQTIYYTSGCGREFP